MLDQLKSSLALLRENKPLVLCLTNYVTMDFMANALLALGAAPLMSESREEIEELASISQAIYINTGTLDEVFIDRAIYAAKLACSLQKPLILDPVGAGASNLRTTVAKELFAYSNSVRGNASEIISLAGAETQTKGVESTDSVDNAIRCARTLANAGKIIVVSGPTDYITNGELEVTSPFGSDLMPLITGMGCTLTAVSSAFAACDVALFQAIVQATAYFGLCGQLASRQAKTPALFKQRFIDNLFDPDWDFFIQAVEGGPSSCTIKHFL